MRYLGIDYGTSKVGVALSDEAGTMGFPREVFKNDEHLLDTLTELIQQQQVGGVVFGESVDFSGSGNPVLGKAHAFANRLQEKTNVQIFWEPEMFTTQLAKRGLSGEHPQHKENVSRVRTGGDEESRHTDASAAALILTSFLSHHDRA